MQFHIFVEKDDCVRSHNGKAYFADHAFTDHCVDHSYDGELTSEQDASDMHSIFRNFQIDDILSVVFLLAFCQYFFSFHGDTSLGIAKFTWYD